MAPPRKSDDQRHMFRCVGAFAVYRDGVPHVYADGVEVLDDDPILKTHREHFEPAAARVLRRPRVEQATAAPGETRRISTLEQEPNNG